MVVILAVLGGSAALGRAQVPAAVNAAAPAPDAAKKIAIAAGYGKLPLSFEANRGQTDPRVRFLSRGNGYSLFLTDSAAVLSLRKPEAPASPEPGPQGPEALPGIAPRLAPKQPAAFKTDVVRMELAGASRGLHVTGDSQLPGTANYFIGNDPAKWHSGVPTYARVRYSQVYPGVDLVYYGNQSQLEYDFVVAPHADPKPIRLHFAGAKKLKLDANGDLEVIAKNGQIAFHKPVVYQEIAGKRKEVEGSFNLIAKNTVAFAIGGYDHGEEVVIDPTLAYSTYLGGSGTPAGDSATSIAVDINGSVYVAGAAGSSTHFPISSSPLQSADNSGSRGDPTVAFVTRLNAAGTALIYSTYLGGSGEYFYGDQANAIAIDAYGDAYVTGSTGSAGLSTNCGVACAFPTTPGAYQTQNNAVANGSYNAFVSKISPDGSTLLYSTFLGGSGFNNGVSSGGDYGAGIAIDSQGEAFVAGTTYSKDFPLSSNPLQGQNNAQKPKSNQYGSNLFVTKLNAEGTGLVYSTYLGGSGFSLGFPTYATGYDYGTSIAVDANGNAYVGGYAHSMDYPVSSNAYQQYNKAYVMNGFGPTRTNGVISKLDITGSTLIYSTYLGGGGNQYQGDQILGIAVDQYNSAYVTGQAASQDFPMVHAFQNMCNLQASTYPCGFVAKLNSEGTDLYYSTYLGGTLPPGGRNGDLTSAIALDNSGDAFVTGSVYSTDFPITKSTASQPNNNENQNGNANYYSGNTFLTELTPDGTGLVYSTYLGGSGSNGVGGDHGNGIAVDSVGNAYIAGSTLSSNFPSTAGVLQPTNNAQQVPNSPTSNAFISKFGSASSYTLIGTTTSIVSDSSNLSQGATVTFTANVQPVSGIGVPTGSIAFSIDGSPATFVALDDTAHASLATSALSSGRHIVTANYYGDVSYLSSQGTVTQVVAGYPSLIAVLSGSGQTASYGSAFSNPLIVVVEDGNGNPVSGVTVSFSGVGLSFSSGTVTTAANGEAFVTAAVQAVGKLTASAAISGVSTAAAFSLTGTKVALTVSAINVKVAFGQPIPALTYNVSGFVNGDTQAALTGTAAETTAAMQGSPIGTYTINISQGTLASPNYTFSFVPGAVAITASGPGNGSQTPPITWPTPAPITYGTPLSGAQLDATSTVAGSFAYYPAAGTVPKVGVQALTAVFTPANTTLYASSAATVPLVVNKAPTTVTWTPPAAITYGTALSVAQLDATSTVPGSFYYYPLAGTTLPLGAQTLSVTFIPTDSADYLSSTATVPLTVNQGATPEVSWTMPAPIAYGTALSAAQLDAVSSVPGSFSYSPAAGTALKPGIYPLSASFTPTNTNSYALATAQTLLVVSKAPTSITWLTPAPISAGTALSAAQLDATASVPGNFYYNAIPGELLPAGQHTLSVTFIPTDTADYLSSTASVTLTVNGPVVAANRK
jgi:hypothetical protein